MGEVYLSSILTCVQEMGSKMRSNGTVSALQQLQQKSSPLVIFSMGGRNTHQKAPVTESKSCKDLMHSNFDKVLCLWVKYVTA